MHVLIAGTTTSGKTTLAKLLAEHQRSRGYGILVCDPLLDKGWQAELVTSNPQKFLHIAQKSRSCMLYLDESGETVGRYNDEMLWLATRARHYGHISHFITQRVVLLNRTVRDQCSKLFLFRVSANDAKTLADDWANTSLLDAASLNRFEFIYCHRFGTTKKFALTQKGAKLIGIYEQESSGPDNSGRLRTINLYPIQ